MKEYKKEFIKFLIDNNSLKFGDFTLKSGRKSPYFLNTGMLYSGEALNKLGHFYAEAIKESGLEFDVVFGPAYKGIPLCVASTMALKAQFDINADYSFNRKEVKDHGDKGLLVGRKLEASDKLVVVDDVITAGTAMREVIEMLKGLGSPKIVGAFVSVDRMEKGQGEKSAIQELSETTGIKFFPIITIEEIIEFLKDFEIDGKKFLSSEMLESLKRYREQYGVTY